MKRMILILYVLVLGLLLCGCSNGVSAGSRGPGDDWSFPGCIKMELEEPEYDLEKTILLHANYGHDYEENFNEDHHILKHTISIYTLDGKSTGNFEKPTEFIEFYSISYEGENVGSETYRCDSGLTIFSKVKYIITVDLNLDFSEIEYDSGLLVMRFDETLIMKDNIDDEIVEREVVQSIYTFLYFLKDDTTIRFSTKSFA